jgi:AraC family transcriptional regulator, alkane utilization regulator
MDALSDILKSVHLEGAVYLNAEFSAPWCVQGECGIPKVKERMAAAEHVMFFHFLTEGACKARLAGSNETVTLVAGDLLLFPQDDRHFLGSDPQIAPMGVGGMVSAEDMASGEFVQIRHGGGGPVTRFVCGYLACNRSLSRPLFEALPRMLRIPVGDGPASSLLRELLRTAVRETIAERPGTESMLSKLSELMFVEAMRRYVDGLPPEGRGWLSGVRDPHVGRALGLMHADPSRAWTVDALAREVALSRSALAARFTTLIGEPPIQYLVRWRLALAARSLRAGGDAIARIAEKSGYESEAAFSRAFKREFGKPPAAWRRSAAVRAAV